MVQIHIHNCRLQHSKRSESGIPPIRARTAVQSYFHSQAIVLPMQEEKRKEEKRKCVDGRETEMREMAEVVQMVGMGAVVLLPLLFR